MNWNWQKKNWPSFTYDAAAMQKYEEEFLYNTGLLFGAYKHINNEQDLRIELISNEALKTSEIEGEYLNRDSLQCSVAQQFGLKLDQRVVPPAEQGIAEMMVDLYQDYNEQLTDKKLFAWHNMLMNGRRDIQDIGCYRTHTEPMQVISGIIGKPEVHFEAPPSNMVSQEMANFIAWFNETKPGGTIHIPALTRAAITHLYFISIHPFIDGNGRIARALTEKSLAQSLGKPTLIALSTIIKKHRKKYYQALEESNKNLEIMGWLNYFRELVFEARDYTEETIDFIIAKTKFYDCYGIHLNPRQEKVIARIFREGISGFKGDLSAENYIKITGTSRATATRDLQDLISKKVMISMGKLKGTRYRLNLDLPRKASK